MPSLVDSTALCGGHLSAPDAFVRYQGIWTDRQWAFKCYSLHYDRFQDLRPDLFALAKAKSRKVRHSGLIHRFVPSVEVHSLGFMVVMEFKTVNFIQINFWVDRDRLCQYLWMADADKPNQFRHVTASGLSCGKWDAKIVAFEYQAWENSRVGVDLEQQRDIYLKSFYQGYSSHSHQLRISGLTSR